MSELIIKKAEEYHIKPMADLDVICFAEPWSEASFRSEITENERALYIAAEIEGQLVGYAGLWGILDEGHITNVAVSPQQRRRGIGRAIVETLIDVAKKNGIKSFTLEVRQSNTAAQALYAQFGFKSAGVRKGYYLDNGEDAIIMWRTGE